jgi:hypothetical protein
MHVESNFVLCCGLLLLLWVLRSFVALGLKMLFHKMLYFIPVSPLKLALSFTDKGGYTHDVSLQYQHDKRPPSSTQNAQWATTVEVSPPETPILPDNSQGPPQERLSSSKKPTPELVISGPS